MHCVHFLFYTVVLYILVLQLFSQYRLLLPTLLQNFESPTTQVCTLQTSLPLAWRSMYTVSFGTIPCNLLCHIHVPCLPQQALYRNFIIRLYFTFYAVLQLYFRIYYYFFIAIQISRWRSLWVFHKRNKIQQTILVKHYIVIQYFEKAVLIIWFMTSKPCKRSINFLSE